MHEGLRARHLALSAWHKELGFNHTPEESWARFLKAQRLLRGAKLRGMYD